MNEWISSTLRTTWIATRSQSPPRLYPLRDRELNPCLWLLDDKGFVSRAKTKNLSRPVSAMPALKITDLYKSVKYGVVANSITELKAKGLQLCTTFSLTLSFSLRQSRLSDLIVLVAPSLAQWRVTARPKQ